MGGKLGLALVLLAGFFEDIVWDLDDNVSANAFDFKLTLIHELLHAFGIGASLFVQPKVEAIIEFLFP